MSYSARLLKNKKVSQFVSFALLSFIAFASNHVLAQGTNSGSIEIIPNTANTNYVASAAEWVTIGVPFAACTVTGAARNDQFKLMDEGSNEVAIFVKETLTWPTRAPCSAESTRALKVQFAFDATGGSKTYTWDLTGRTTANDLSEAAVSEITNDQATRASYMEPRVFGIHDDDYLVQTGLVPPTSPLTTEVYDTNYFPTAYNLEQVGLDFTTTEAAHWLFDRPTTVYRQAIRRADVSVYREAYLSHEFYVERIDDNNVPNNAAESDGDACVGCWAFGDKAKNGDPKYIYVEPLKLHLALTGDDSWTPDANTYANTRTEMFVQMAQINVNGDTRAPWTNGIVAPQGFIDPYVDIEIGYTERKTGIGLNAVLNSCQLTLDATVCGWADTIVDNIHSHMKSNPDGTGDLGYLSHSWGKHEGEPVAWLGSLTVNNGTSIRITNTIGSVSKLTAGDSIRVGNANASNDYTLASNATDIGGGVWEITLTGSVTGSVDDSVWGKEFDLDSDRAYSTWMTIQIADPVWQYYNWTTDSARKTKAAEILHGFGTATAKYSFYGIERYGNINPTYALVESAFSTPGETIDFYQLASNPPTETGCNLIKAPMPYYASNNLINRAGSDANDRWIREYINFNGDFADGHVPDLMFLLALGLFFETDSDRRAAFQALVDDSVEWYEKHTCTAGLGPPRTFNWQNKPDPFGTLKYVESFALSYSASTLNESNANDGSITETITLTIGGTRFADPGGAGTYTSGVDFAVNNLPAGFTGATLTYVNPTTATLALTGSATANDPADNISNLEFQLMDSALVDSFDADRITGSTKSDISLVYINPKVTYSTTTFTESNANDGATTTQITIDLVGDTFSTNTGAFPGGSFSVTGLPAGTLSASLTANSATQAVLSLTGNASPHGNANETASINFQFEDGAFTTTGTASDVTDYSNTLSIEFFEPALSYSATTFNENTATNDGAISNSLVVTLADDTFVVNGGAMTETTHFTVANVPAGLTLEVTGTSDTTATVSLSGTASSNDVDISDLTLNFLPAALTTSTDVTNVVGANTANLGINYVAPALSYGGSVLNEDASTNNGAISGSLAITLTDDSFAVPGGAMTQGTHYTVANLPPGLTPVVTGTSATTATFSLSGTANSHGNSDELGNIALNFLPAAFVNSISTANIANASKTDLGIGFVEPAIAYGGTVFNENAATNNGVIANTLALTLGEDSFRCSSCSLTSGVDFTTANLPANLVVGIDIDGTGQIATVSLTGAATTHENADDVSNFTLNFTDAAFSTSPAASILEAMKMDIAINFFQDGIEYDFNKFTESDNNGSTATVLNLTLLGDTFVVTGGAMTESTHYTVAGVPAGMAAVVTGTSGNTATLALTGSATSHTDSDDVSDLTLTFLDAAFTGNDASVIANSTKNDLMIEFVDGNVSFAESVFHEATTNNGAISNSIEISLTGDKFAAGPFTSPTHFTTSNVPAVLTAVVTRNSDSSATFSLTGTATNSDNSHDVSNLGLTFTGAAFAGADAASVNGSSKSDFQIDFVDALISYSGTALTESAANTGIVDTTLNLTLVGDGFVINGGQMLANTHYTVANVPDGLAAVVTGISSTEATLALTGTATSHTNANDVFNLTLTFLNSAFTNGDASSVGSSSVSNLSVDFADPAASGGGSGGSGGSGGGSSGGGSSDDTANNDSPPPQPTVPPVNSGTLTGLELTATDSIQNQGTLADFVNGGTVNGGTVSGTVTNSGTLNNVSLAAGTVVNGGTISGTVSNSGTLNGVNLAAGTVVDGGRVSGALVGSGTITNTVLDVTELGPEVTLGKGVKITNSAAKNTSGLDLSAVIRGDNGELDLNQPILVSEDSTEKTAADLAVDAVNALLGNGVTEIKKNANENAPTTIDNPAITGAVVVVTPSRVETTNEPDGVTLNSRGELQIVSNGIKIAMAPSPTDSAAFTAGLEASGATSSSLADGLVTVDFNGSTFSFQFSYLATQSTSTGSLVRSQSNTASFTEVGNISDPSSYRIVVQFPDGSSQELIPRVHDLDHFEAWMAGDGYTTQIDGLTGIISIMSGGVEVFRGIPSYLLEQPQGSTLRVNFENLEDLNLDGVGDLHYISGKYRQIIYGVAQP